MFTDSILSDSHQLHGFAVGAPSPYGVRPESNFLQIGPGGLALVLSFQNPTATEIDQIRHAPLRCGLAAARGISTALLVWRFDGSQALWMDTPFNVCIDPNKRNWSLPERLSHQHLMMMVVLQDSWGRIRALRTLTVPPKLMTAIEAAVEAQADATRSGVWHASEYVHDIERLYRRWSSPQAAMRDAVRADLGI
jgi:hypothetical protein